MGQRGGVRRYRTEYDILIRRCEEDLRSFTGLLEKYNALPEKKPSLRKGIQRLKFGNGEMLDLDKMRIRINAHKLTIVMFLQSLGLGSLGRIERRMNEDMELKSLVMWIYARIEANGKGQSDWTSCATEEKTWWRTFRRQLLRHSIPFQKVDEKKELIMDLFAELSSKGVLDDPIEEESHAADVKQNGGIPTAGLVNQAPEAPGTDDLGSLMLKVESEDFQSSLVFSSGEFEAQTIDGDHNPYIKPSRVGETRTKWPDQLLLRMQTPIDFGELDAILSRYGVPEEHAGQWMKLFSSVARHLYPNGGLIVQEYQYDWDIWAGQKGSMTEWTNGKYKTYSTELELFRLDWPQFCPPTVKMELVPYSSVGLCVRAYTPSSDRGKDDGLKFLLMCYELVKVPGIDNVFHWELLNEEKIDDKGKHKVVNKIDDKGEL
ncbi:hypothetical protein DL95DRAFT_470142 [Leptodontidium sp. 2 PMI_412]|nr:hypothetical protein DL95DRAFT_470142 [Leptodontidium sp. 2 PMI_412]